jgi:hypothetical protein
MGRGSPCPFIKDRKPILEPEGVCIHDASGGDLIQPFVGLVAGVGTPLGPRV